jgi:hypothetical protein
MKTSLNILLFTPLFLFLSCQEAGSLERVDNESSDIEVYRYFYAKGSSVFVARFKDSPNVVTTTWEEREGKFLVTKGNISIFENDSILIIYKKP